MRTIPMQMLSVCCRRNLFGLPTLAADDRCQTWRCSFHNDERRAQCQFLSLSSSSFSFPLLTFLNRTEGRSALHCPLGTIGDWVSGWQLIVLRHIVRYLKSNQTWQIRKNRKSKRYLQWTSLMILPGYQTQGFTISFISLLIFISLDQIPGKKVQFLKICLFFLFALFANWCFGKFGSVSGNLVNRQFMLSLATVVPAVDINNCTCHCTHHCCSFRSTTLLESVCALLPTILPKQIKLSYKRQTVSMAVGGSQCSSLFPCPSHHHCRLHLR